MMFCLIAGIYYLAEDVLKCSSCDEMSRMEYVPGIKSLLILWHNLYSSLLQVDTDSYLQAVHPT